MGDELSRRKTIRLSNLWYGFIINDRGEIGEDSCGLFYSHLDPPDISLTVNDLTVNAYRVYLQFIRRE